MISDDCCVLRHDNIQSNHNIQPHPKVPLIWFLTSGVLPVQPTATHSAMKEFPDGELTIHQYSIFLFYYYEALTCLNCLCSFLYWNMLLRTVAAALAAFIFPELGQKKKKRKRKTSSKNIVYTLCNI